MAGAGAQTLFQSTHPSGVRLCKTYRNMQPRAFQSTHPSGVRLCRAQFKHRIRRISIHAPQWGATRQRHHDNRRNQFQSTHPSGVRRQRRDMDRHLHGISIHAPQWGATTTRDTQAGYPLISIHAPQWGATGEHSSSPQFEFGFQSTHPSGVRLTRLTGSSCSSNFNPRTPVGCDSQAGKNYSARTYFNPRTPVGCDPETVAVEVSRLVFQSTHPSGVRLASNAP